MSAYKPNSGEAKAHNISLGCIVLDEQRDKANWELFKSWRVGSMSEEPVYKCVCCGEDIKARSAHMLVEAHKQKSVIVCNACAKKYELCPNCHTFVPKTLWGDYNLPINVYEDRWQLYNCCPSCHSEQKICDHCQAPVDKHAIQVAWEYKDNRNEGGRIEYSVRTIHNICKKCHDRLIKNGEIFFCTCCNAWYFSRQYRRFTVNIIEKNGEIVILKDMCIICHTAISRRYQYNKQCQKCNSIFVCQNLQPLTEYFKLLHGVGRMCINCIKNYKNLVKCKVCGGYFRESDGDSAKNVCGSCYTVASRSGHDRFRQYSYKPEPKFKQAQGEKTNNNLSLLYMGFELELECPDSSRGGCINTVCELDRTEDVFYIKPDGSLNNGIEFVSHPATLLAHKELNWEDFFNKIDDTSLIANSRCGLHIHASRSAMTPMTETKIALFIHGCKDRIQKIARRSGNNYSQYISLAEKKRRLMMADQRTHSKYMAVHLTDTTFEFRVFKATTDFNELMGSLEFVHAVVSFCSVNPINLMTNAADCWKEFCRFVESPINKKLYQYLPKQLKDSKAYVKPSAVKFDNKAPKYIRGMFSNFVLQDKKTKKALALKAKEAKEQLTKEPIVINVVNSN